MWDCGLACTLMVLRVLGNTHTQLSDLVHSLGTESVWTVDLARLLAQHGAPVTLCTTSPGVRNDYAAVPFYRDQLANDRTRVEAAFRGLPPEVSLHVGSLSVSTLLNLVLSARVLLVLLVDKAQLTHCQGDVEHARENGIDGYLGHYVVVLGADLDQDALVVADPARAEWSSVRVPIPQLERARKAHGTDEDILIIHLPDRLTPVKISSDHGVEDRKGDGREV